MADVQAAIEYIFPLIYEFRKERTPEEIAQLALKRSLQNRNTISTTYEETCPGEEESDGGDGSWD